MKTPWETRVGMLLDPRFHSQFVYSYKPYDSPHYGGQPRIDWHAADLFGTYWLIEVKSLAPGRKTINLDKDMSAGQRAALYDLAHTVTGIPLLIVGQNKTAYIFRWKKVLTTPLAHPYLLPMTNADLTLDWSPKAWKEFNLFEAIKTLEFASSGFPGIPVGSLPPGTTPVLVKGPPPPFMVGSVSTLPPSGIILPNTPAPPSPSTSKPKGSIRTRRRKLLSGPLLSKPPD